MKAEKENDNKEWEEKGGSIPVIVNKAWIKYERIMFRI